MSKEKREEIKEYLLFLELYISQIKGDLSAWLLQAMARIEAKYSWFWDIRNENKKLYRWLSKDGEDEEEKAEMRSEIHDSGRWRLASMFDEWTKETGRNPAPYNVIDFLMQRGLLDEKKIIDFLNGGLAECL